MSLSPALSAALLGNGNYQPQLGGATVGTSTTSSLLSTLGGASLGGASQDILSSAYQSVDVGSLVASLGDAVDETTLASLLHATQYTSSVSLYGSLGGVDLYQDTVNLLSLAYPAAGTDFSA